MTGVLVTLSVPCKLPHAFYLAHCNEIQLNAPSVLRVNLIHNCARRGKEFHIGFCNNFIHKSYNIEVIVPLKGSFVTSACAVFMFIIS